MPAERPGAPKPGGEGGTLAELARSLQSRTISSEAVTDTCLARIVERDPSINAFITVLADEARAQARAADQEIAAGRYRGPLHGVPISLKDLIDLRGTPTSAASRVRRGHVAARDSVVAARLRAAGAVFVGKTNLHEFALGTTNEDSAYRSCAPSARSQSIARRILWWIGGFHPGRDVLCLHRLGHRRLDSDSVSCVRSRWSEAGSGRNPDRRRGAAEQHARSHRPAVPVGRGRRHPASDARRSDQPDRHQAARASWTAPRPSRGRTSSRGSTPTSRLASTSPANG